MFKRTLLFLFTVLFFALLVCAAPVPSSARGLPVKKALKQLKLKRGGPTPVRREEPHPSYRYVRSRFASLHKQ